MTAFDLTMDEGESWRTLTAHSSGIMPAIVPNGESLSQDTSGRVVRAPREPAPNWSLPLTFSLRALLLLIASSSVVAGQIGADPKGPATSSPGSSPAPASESQLSATDGRIDKILSELEKHGDNVKDLRCKVVFVEDDQINLTKRRKLGEILFLVTEPNPHFLIRFDRTEADGVLGKREWYLFDGRWLYQAVERIEQVIKQEITRPGETIDLFDLETAPFPLPFGQKKDKITRNFDVTLQPPTVDSPDNTDHLICIPKPGGKMHGKYDKLEFFVRRDLRLPSRIVVTKNNGLEISTADFTDLSSESINVGVKKKAFREPAAWKKYEVVVEELAPLE